MDRIDLTKTHGIRRTQNLMDFLQQSYTELFAGLAAMIGNNVIVAGVTDLGANYSDGWVVINGELLPFSGGLKNNYIIVTEVVTQARYGDGVDRDAFYTRFAQCAGAGGTLVSSFTRIPNLYQLVTQSQLTTTVNNLIAGAPGALDTLKELADAMADDPNFATTVINLIATEVTNRTNAINAEATARANGDALNLPKAGGSMTGALVNSSTGEFDGGIRTQNSGPYFKTIKIDIGDWDMDANNQVTVSFTGDVSKIRQHNIMIRADDDAVDPFALYQSPFFDISAALQLWSSRMRQTGLTTVTIDIFRTAGGTFDSTQFDDTSFNRGWILIEYEA